MNSNAMSGRPSLIIPIRFKLIYHTIRFSLHYKRIFRSYKKKEGFEKIVEDIMFAGKSVIQMKKSSFLYPQSIILVRNSLPSLAVPCRHRFPWTTTTSNTTNETEWKKNGKTGATTNGWGNIKFLVVQCSTKLNCNPYLYGIRILDRMAVAVAVATTRRTNERTWRERTKKHCVLEKIKGIYNLFYP